MSWHQIDCLAFIVYEAEQERHYVRTGFRTGTIDGRPVRVAYQPSASRWVATVTSARSMVGVLHVPSLTSQAPK